MPGSIALLRDNKKKDCQPLLQTLIAVLHAEMKAYSYAFIVVDALDEISGGAQMDLIEKLRSLTSNSSIKLLITSRHIDIVGDSIGADARLDIIADKNDIKLYLETRLSSPHAGTIKRLLKASSLTEADVVRKIMEKARGMYVKI
jgi:hypothetical protein